MADDQLNNEVPDKQVSPKSDSELIEQPTEASQATASAKVPVSAVTTINEGTPDQAKGLKYKFRKLGGWAKQHKKKASGLVAVLVLVILLAVPVTRYGLLSLVKKQTVDVAVVDSQTGQPVTEAQVLLGKTAEQTNKEGLAEFTHVKLGKTTLQISKTYYQQSSSSITIGLSRPHQIKAHLVATGRQVPITVVNKINGSVVVNALVQSLGSKTRTDQNGQAILVLPADKQTASAQVSANGYNNANVTVKVTTSHVPDNDFSIVPAGKIYFLSKLSGTIDVVKTNLDGSDRTTVLAGTGSEDESGTVLLASKDWNYLGLLSKRDNNPAKLYLINTANDKLTTIDSDSATFTITGWLNHYFIYSENKGGNNWQPGNELLKSYNADSGKLTVLDQTNAEGTGPNDYAYETYAQIYALNNLVLFSKNWNAYFTSQGRLANKQATINSISADGSGRKTLKSLGLPSGSSNSVISFDSRAYDPGGVYFNDSVDSNFYKFDNGNVTSTNDVTADNFYTKVYPTFLQSPNSQQNFWSESRDGKNTLFVGDADGQNGQQIATLSDFTQYGWYTDNYLLVSKNSSELYIMAKDGKHPAIKITDYHKPVFNYLGYGGGYGGFNPSN